MSLFRNILAASVMASFSVLPGIAMAGPLPVVNTESTLLPPVYVPPANVTQQLGNLSTIPVSVYTGFTQVQLQQIIDLATQLLDTGNLSGSAEQQLETVRDNAEFAMQQ